MASILGGIWWCLVWDGVEAKFFAYLQTNDVDSRRRRLLLGASSVCPSLRPGGLVVLFDVPVCAHSFATLVVVVVSDALMPYHVG